LPFGWQDSLKHSLGFFAVELPSGRGEVFRYKTPQKPLQEEPLNEVPEPILNWSWDLRSEVVWGSEKAGFSGRLPAADSRLRQLVEF
jgi:hypothetical protein